MVWLISTHMFGLVDFRDKSPSWYFKKFEIALVWLVQFQNFQKILLETARRKLWLLRLIRCLFFVIPISIDCNFCYRNYYLKNNDSTLFNVVNSKVEIHNFVSTLVWCCPTSRIMPTKRQRRNNIEIFSG